MEKEKPKAKRDKQYTENKLQNQKPEGQWDGLADKGTCRRAGWPTLIPRN